MLKKAAEEKRVDPRIKRTRQALQQALVALMAEQSFEALTVQEIAERAMVNRVTFYAHFNDKYALLEDTMRSEFQGTLRGVLPESAPFTPENLVRLIQLVGEVLTGIQGHCPPPRGQWEPLMEKQIKAEVFEVLRGWLGEEPAARSPRGATPEEAAMIATWAIYGAAMHWSQQARREPAHEFAQRVLPLILASLQPVAQVSG